MANLKNLTIGQVLYTTYSSRMGNTTMKTTNISSYVVKEINLTEGYCVLESHGREYKYSEQRLKKMRVNKPELEETFTGRHVLKRKVKENG